MKNSQKKTCVITGGSSGIGLELAKQFTQDNYACCILGRNQEKLTSAKTNVSQLGKECNAYAADVSKWSDLLDVSKDISTQFSHVDVLIVNAGIVHVNTVTDMSAENLDAIIRTNLIGAINTVKAFLPYMREKSQIIFIASGFGIIGPAGYAAYSASKAGIITFAESLKREVLARKIKVQVACLTDTDTPQYREEFAKMPHWMKDKSNPRAKVMSTEKVARLIRKKRLSNKFFIFVSFDVLMAHVLTKLLPRNFRDWVLNRLFPLPPPMAD